MNRKLFLSIAIMSLLVALVAAPNYTEAKVKTFKDVQSTHANYTEITEMANKGIISGYPDGTFKPDQYISRKHVATLLSRAFPEKPVRLNWGEDINKSDPYYNDVMRALGSGWLKTTSTFNVRPNENMTRGEMAIALGALLPDEIYKTDSKKFKDVTGRYEYEVTKIVIAGIATGYPDDTFKPDEPLTRAHYTTFMYRTLDYLAKNPEAYEFAKNPLYTNAYIIKFPRFELPNPKGQTYEEAQALIKKYKDAMPSGSFKGLFSTEDEMSYNSILKQTSKASGVSKELVAEMIDKAAKTGEVIKFKGTNGKSYFLFIQFRTSSVMIGEDHLK